MVDQEYQQDEYEEGYEDEYEEEGTQVIPNWLRETPYWAISGAIHLVLLLILYNILSEPPAKETEQVPIQILPVPERKDKYDPTLERAMEKKPKILHEKEVEKPIVQRKLDEVTPDIPKGTSLDNNTNVELLSDQLNDAIGVGGGAAGAYGERWGKGSLINEGGSAGTEAAVRAALEWLKRHQREDGGWSAHDFAKECQPAGKNKNPQRYPEDRGFEQHDVGVTALAMLAFAGFGHTHLDGKYPDYVEVLRKAVNYMKSVQIRTSNPNRNGVYGINVPDEGVEETEHEQWIYDHSIATMAMGELLAMSGDAINLQESVTDAVRFCLHAQNHGLGWKYEVKSGFNDTSVTGWMVLALKTAKNAGLDIPPEDYERAFEGALKWFDAATSVDGKTGYEAPGDPGSSLANVFPDPYPYSKELSCMTAVAVLCRLFAGERRSDPVIQKGVDILMKHKPLWREQEGKKLSTINMYYWYYASYALFQFGGNLWDEWNEDMIQSLVSTQRQEFDPKTKEPDCIDGSWDPIGEWGIAGGRVYSTAIGAMTLEVYYRFKRARDGIGF